MFYKFLLIMTLFIFTGCNTNNKNLTMNNNAFNKNVINNPEKAFVLRWKIEKNVITRIPQIIREKLKVRCVNYNRFVLIKIITYENDNVKGTFECRI
jgi:hypothetical protein